MSKEKRRVPKLRFPGFTEDWEQRKLGECIDSFAYGLNAAAKEYDGMHKYIRITDIDDETHNFIQSNLTSPDIDFNMDVSDYKLNVGDIVFARTGASVGKTYLYTPNDGALYYAGFLIRGRVKESCDAGFIYQNTLTKDYESFIRITSQRSGQPGVNSKEYATFSLNIPCKDEQEKISKVLNSLDELFTLHQRKLNNLKLKKKALLQKLFPKNGERYPELRFPGFTDAWEQRELSSLTKYIGTGKSRFVIKEYGEYAILGSTNVIGYDDSYDYDGNFILTARVGANAGQLYRYSGKVKITDNTVFLMSDNSQFIYYSLSHFDLRRLSFGTGQPLVKSSELQKLKLCVPVSKSEQEKIGEIFNNIDNIITLHQRKLKHLQIQKKSLLQKLFV